MSVFNQKPPSLNHPICTPEYRRCDAQAQSFGGLEVYDQFDFGDLLYGQVLRFLPVENAADVDAHQTILFNMVASVAHQTAGCNKFRDREKLPATHGAVIGSQVVHYDP